MFEFDSIRFIYDIDTVELTRGVDFICGCIYGLVRSHMVAHGFVRSLIRLYTDMAPVPVFLNILKIIHGFHGYTRMARVNSDRATVGSVECTVSGIFFAILGRGPRAFQIGKISAVNH